MIPACLLVFCPNHPKPGNPKSCQLLKPFRFCSPMSRDARVGAPLGDRLLGPDPSRVLAAAAVVVVAGL